ncbi:thiol peroxidase [Flavobacterium akiainvivens]|uniref:Thiol peroxidase n=1 Tax=Flavobacterium akiainvivens TaxID=1202724 RepID=A0A0N0RQC2_9FLAO|nr:thiol peroxidase [Flavobacterium akiainvivens]KOS04780.1 thiol peroxidase [Flavobacterium akiainvivens]SFQ66338.1 thiol peroxidase (atypical 2-Cys peroxiredoxin) [Flavobacterium akiainvivens]
MADITLFGDPVKTWGELPEVGTQAPGFSLITNNLEVTTLDDFKGTKLIINIFPSIDTQTCALSVRRFNEKASGLENTKILCVSRDLPFAQDRFCAAEGLENVITLSDYRNDNFGENYGVMIDGGKLSGLHSRAIVVIDENGVVKYTEQVPELKDEPNYDAALNAL